MKTVVVTGASRGIGREAALHMLGLGHNIVLNYHVDDALAHDTLEECRRVSANVILVKADVSQSADVNLLLQAALDEFKVVDVLINNASINIDRSLFDLSEEDWDQVIDVDMKSVFLTSKLFSQAMMDQEGGGHIINMGALTGMTGRANGLNYCAAKAGVLVMTKCLAIELAPKIRVNCVIPGTIRTPEVEQRYNLDENEQDMAQQILAKRIGEPKDIANVLEFLVSDKSDYITGQKLIVDGGSFLY